jgi:hypothetical protein
MLFVDQLRLPTQFKVLCTLLISVAIGILCTYAEPAVASLRPLASLVKRCQTPYLVDMHRECRLVDERERVKRVWDVEILQATHALLLYYILHTYLYYILQILTEKGEQRLEEERRKRDREECERVDEDLKRVHKVDEDLKRVHPHKEVEYFCTSKASFVLAKPIKFTWQVEM